MERKRNHAFVTFTKKSALIWQKKALPVEEKRKSLLWFDKKKTLALTRNKYVTLLRFDEKKKPALIWQEKKICFDLT